MTDLEKEKAYISKRRRYVREQLKLHPPFGSEMVLYGSIIILLWALGELNASYTFIVAWFKVDTKIIDLGYISKRDYIEKIIMTTPEAKAALRQLLMLIMSIAMGLVGIIFRRRKIVVPVLMILTALVLSTYEVSEPFWMRVTSYTRYVKLFGCALLFAGSACKIATWAMKRQMAAQTYDQLHAKKKKKKLPEKADTGIGSIRPTKTLIPERVDTKRK